VPVPLLLTVALSMPLGNVLKAIPHADRAPDGIAPEWSIQGVLFTLETKRLR
jgi:hypothetical protein